MALACVVCADDFALTDGVSRAILSLLEAGRISATGAMTNRPGWMSWAHELAAFSGQADLGVHLNLTAGAPLTHMRHLAPDGRFPALATVMIRAARSGEVRAEIAAEFAAQIACFTQSMGRAPDFIDGHQHVHAMPGVGAVTLRLLTTDRALATAYVRDPTDHVAAIIARGAATAKALVVNTLAAPFAARLRQAGHSRNIGFSGFSAFDPRQDQHGLLVRQTHRPGARHLIMCHPGEADDHQLAGLDRVIATRALETAALRTVSDVLAPRRMAALPLSDHAA